VTLRLDTHGFIWWLEACHARWNEADFSLAVSVAHALAVRALPPHHADPFDRLLVAQAEAEGLTLVTADAVFGRYGVPTLDACR
jgi:PIN domain nuclease of toxin-antitoxin system